MIRYKKPQITQAELKALYEYDPITGVLTSKATGQAVGSRMPDGYVEFRLRGLMVSVHRVAFLYMQGMWPRDQVDHVNGVRHDNRWSNLRQATATQNAQNRRPTAKHAFNGVRMTGNGKWRAQIMVDGVRQNIPGTFDTAEAAHRAYKTYAGMHFGQFARTVAPITGAMPAQNDEFSAQAQLDMMKKRQLSVAKQLADIDEAIAALEAQLQKRAARKAA